MAENGITGAYRDDGYVLIKGVLDKAEAARYRRECHDLLARINEPDPTWGSARELTEGAVALKHCHDVQFHSAAFVALLVDRRFTDLVAAAMGSENVQLHHTKMFVKPPTNGSPFPLHQDAPFFPHERHTVGAAIFHFDDAPEEKGCVHVVPGSHRGGLLEHRPEGGWHLPFAEWPLDRAVACPAEAGDLLLFNYHTVHGSGVNVSDEARTTLLVQYRDPTDRPTTDDHTSSLGQGMMLRGIDPTGRRSARMT